MNVSDANSFNNWISGVDNSGQTHFMGLVCFDLGQFVGVQNLNLTVEVDKYIDQSPKP